MGRGRRRYSANAYVLEMSGQQVLDTTKRRAKARALAPTKHRSCNCKCDNGATGQIRSRNTDLLRHIISAGELGGWDAAATRLLDFDVAPVAVEPCCDGDGDGDGDSDSACACKCGCCAVCASGTPSSGLFGFFLFLAMLGRMLRIAACENAEKVG